jgi:alkanesulfonate monooxygenase SsuD/methylene tetrahydromethanopterin reductase-like flavin-dependent oxidoreductase (luciferase family)
LSVLGPAKIRIGMMPGPWPEGPAAGELFWRLVELCETSTIDSLWLSDRLLAPTLEPLVALAAAAARTRRLKFGTAVLVLPFRSPILTASAWTSGGSGRRAGCRPELAERGPTRRSR